MVPTTLVNIMEYLTSSHTHFLPMHTLIHNRFTCSRSRTSRIGSACLARYDMQALVCVCVLPAWLPVCLCVCSLCTSYSNVINFVKRSLRTTLLCAWMLKPGMDQRKDLFASRHCKHSLPCTDQQPAESLASTRNAFARRALRSTSCRVSVHGVARAKKTSEIHHALVALSWSALLQADKHPRARRYPERA